MQHQGGSSAGKTKVTDLRPAIKSKKFDQLEHTISLEQPKTKRLKLLHFYSIFPHPTLISVGRAVPIGTTNMPGVAWCANFNPLDGVRRLPIKNLRQKSQKEADEYYNGIKEEINSAFTSVFAQESPDVPLEALCRGVEMICRRGQAEELFTLYGERTKSYIERVLLPQIEQEATATHLETLRTVFKFWKRWTKESGILRSIFSYLDRFYLLKSKDFPLLEDLGIQQFRHAVFTKGKTANGQRLGDEVISNICDLVDYNRTRQAMLFDPTLLRESIQMLHILGIYSKIFEPKFLERSHSFFCSFTTAHAESDIKEYTIACNSFITREELCCDTYNFASTTKRNLSDLAHKCLVEDVADILLDKTGLAKLIDENEIDALKTLFDLLNLSKIESRLKIPFENYIKDVGSSVVTNLEKGDEMVIRLLELKKNLDIIIRDSFRNEESFSYCLRDAFGHFMNDSKNLSVWGTKSSKVGEMIAKYIDMLLRGGTKAIPPSLIIDTQDRATAEHQGLSSIGDEDAELDWQLEQALELFRFIEGKDVFEAFYKKDLARRLLLGRSASQDAERNMLAKLKVECGYTYTHNLEQMFKDQEIARDEMISYRHSLGNKGKPSIDLHVSVLFAAAWPSYPDVTVNIPSEVAQHIENYDRFYMSKHTGRRLSWKHALAHSVVKAHFNKGSKELLVSAFQAIVLILFNDVKPNESISYLTIQKITGLIDSELQRTLQSLACAKFRVLIKHPKGRNINTTDTFTVNANFTDPKYKVKINQIQLKETKEETKETHEKVLRDRQYETQAAIVRIMKSRKTMTHSNLISEVIEQTKKRGAVEVLQIKANIDKLIDKEYLERSNSTTYVYCA
ncbi:Cullin-4A [Podosphaera aphanis]|nr:Cullin-4A [Podosphaera aphanis]